MSDRVCHISRLKRYLRLYALCALFSLNSMGQTAGSKKTSAPDVRSPEAVFTQVGSSVYIVEAISAHGDVVGQQTGVAISKHIVVSTRNLIGTFVSPKSRRVSVARYRIRQGHQLWDVSNIYVDFQHDVARFESIDLIAMPAQLAPDAKVSGGDVVYAVSYPKDQTEMIAKGRVFPPNTPADHEGLLAVSFQSDAESAGGGVFNARGALIGVLTVDPVTGRTAVAPVAWGHAAALLYSGIPQNPAAPDKNKDLWLKVQTFGLSLQTFSDISLAHQGKTVNLFGEAENENPEVGGLENSHLLSLLDEHAPETFGNWPTWRKALGSMEELRLEMEAAEESGATEGSDSASIVRTVLVDGRKLWSEASDAFCAEVPGAPFTDLEGRKRECLR